MDIEDRMIVAASLLHQIMAEDYNWRPPTSVRY